MRGKTTNEEDYKSEKIKIILLHLSAGGWLLNATIAATNITHPEETGGGIVHHVFIKMYRF